jgi:hypothetical protein
MWETARGMPGADLEVGPLSPCLDETHSCDLRDINAVQLDPPRAIVADWFVLDACLFCHEFRGIHRFTFCQHGRILSRDI